MDLQLPSTSTNSKVSLKIIDGISRRRLVKDDTDSWLDLFFDAAEVQCEHEKKTIDFNGLQIIRGQCSEHYPWKCILFGSTDIATGKLYQLSEWTIENQDDILDEYDQTKVLKRIKGIEKEFEHLSKLRNPNLINYVKMKYSEESESRIVVYLLSDFVMGLNCNNLYLFRRVPVEVDMLRNICKSVLNALDFLHSHKIVHKNVCAECIFICNNGQIKLANFGFYQKLTDLVLHDVDSKQYSQKRDIFKVGVTVLSLLTGSVVDEDDIAIPGAIGIDIQDFVDNCISKNSPKANKLLSHPFLSQLPMSSNDIDLNNLIIQGSSHLKSGFEHIEFIGKGAFGNVHKVLNKLDKRIYALKMIKVNNKKPLETQKIKREVKLLSGLNHENVVKYCHSWIEKSDTAYDNVFEIFDTSSIDDETQTSSEDENDDASDKKQYEIMLILMEFCDMNTLQNAIEADLYKDADKLWRFLREILEGLAYIHKQGIIHRDLKPVNIFLDASDHVKIGDFGLATSSMRTKYGLSESCNELGSICDSSSLTGQIGTTSYRAPECSTAKAKYDQKIDMYSLGIIFFEMSYKPCTTGMERHKILINLRSKERVFPEDAGKMMSPTQTLIIHDLLEHDDTKRPTAQELLHSEHLPPPIPKEKELKDMLRHTLQNTGRKEYKHLVQSCLNQQVTSEQDIAYDKDMNAPFNLPRLKTYNRLKDFMVELFRSYKAHELNTPVTIPKNKCYEGYDSVRLMTNSGSVITLPYDLRIPFARYVAMNGVKSLRRYSIAKVYREKRAFGHIPKEMYECAFDIVISSEESNKKGHIPRTLMANARVIQLLHELAVTLPGLRDKTLLIRLNHMSLLKAILLHCGIKDRHAAYSKFIADLRRNKVTPKNYSNISSLEMAKVVKVIKFLNNEASIDEIQTIIYSLTKHKKRLAGTLARRALDELQCIIEKSRALGVTTNIMVNLGIIYSTPQYSGMTCQLVCSSLRKDKPIMEVIAVGGGYDELIQSYNNMIGVDHTRRQSAVGVSIYLEKLVVIYSQHVQENDINETELDQAINTLKNKSTKKVPDQGNMQDDFDIRDILRILTNYEHY